MAHSRNGAAALLEMAKKKTLPDDLAFTAGNELRAVPNKETREAATALFPPPAAKDAKPLPPIAVLIRTKGDAANGKVVYTANCAKCHQVNGEGIDFGPNLSEIGTKLAKDAICEAILNPSAAISFGYEGKTLKLKTGDLADGLIASQTADEIVFKTSTGTAAILTRYKRADVAEIREMKQSIMPEGMQAAMTTQEFVDLVEYLAALKKK
jgi:putative heme-binding domain-containing protein